MKYFEETTGVWQELLPNSKKTIEPDAYSISTAASVPGDRTLHRSKSTSSHYSLKSTTTDGQGSSPSRHPLARALSGRYRKRVILKNGTVNLSKEHVSKRHQRYLQDIFTTMVDIQWRWNLLVFAMGFILSWLIFALIWWLICLAHGDFDHIEDPDWNPCVLEVKSFATAFLFSVETQHTIGYGSRCTNDECPEAIFIMCIQSITGVMIQCFMAGIVFAKLSRPKKRSQTLMFSRYATMCLRDGKMCFMFRVGDMRKSHIIGSQISAHIIRRKITAEGEMIPYYHTGLDLRCDDGGDNLFLIWPATIVHEINDNTSPFFLKSAEDMMKERYEVVVILEGTIESTGQSIQARSSYVPAEILWGHRFDQVVSFRKETGEYVVDYSKFNATQEVQTPLCCPKDLYEYQRLVSEIPKSPSFITSPLKECLSLSSIHRRSPVDRQLSEPNKYLCNGESIVLERPPKTGSHLMIERCSSDEQETPNEGDSSPEEKRTQGKLHPCEPEIQITDYSSVDVQC